MITANQGKALLTLLMLWSFSSFSYSQTPTSAEDCNRLIWSNLSSSSISSLEKGTETLGVLAKSEVVEPNLIAFRESTQEIFFFDRGDHSLKKTDINGLSIDVLVSTGLSNLGGLVLDDAAGKMYWSDWGNGNIKSANVDGSGIVVIHSSSVSNPGGMDIDVANQKLYWTDAGLKTVMSSNVDGSGIQTLITGLSYPRGVALDMPNSKIYWSDAGLNRISKAEMDGSSIQTVASTGIVSPLSLSIDDSAEKIYCTDWGTFKILKMNYDGSQLQSLADASVSLPNSIVFDNTNNRVYWVDWASDKIVGANADGSAMQDVVSSLSSEGIAVNTATNEVYWTDYSSKRIIRSAADGSNQTMIVDGLNTPKGIAIHQNSQTMYWADSGSKNISKANLDGTDRQIIIGSGLIYPNGVAVDQTNERVYWSDSGFKKIESAKFDGTDRKTIISTGLISPEGLAIDHMRSKLYWIDLGTNNIRKSNLDGSEVEMVVSTGVSLGKGIAIDEFYGYLYWTNASDDKVKRISLSGGTAETYIENATNSYPAALAITNSECYELGVGEMDDCQSLGDVYIDDTNNNDWLPIKDSAGNLLAFINGNGNNLGMVNSQVFVGSEDVRYVSGEPYARRDIQISVENQPTTTALVRLFYAEDEINDLITEDANISSPNEIQVHKVDDSCSGAYGGSGTAIQKDLVANYGNDYLVDVEVFSFSTFHVLGQASVLAVSFGYFEAEEKRAGIELNWSTETEINTNYFEVLRKNTENEFELVGAQDAKGSGSKYSMMDIRPENGYNYYRIKEYDFDGNTSLSKVISVEWDKEVGVRVFPNPVKDVLYLTNESGSNESRVVTITGLDGKVLLANEVNGQSVNVSQIPNGLYIIKITEESNVVFTDKLIIQK